VDFGRYQPLNFDPETGAYNPKARLAKTIRPKKPLWQYVVDREQEEER
jgi:hypothetical protein